MLQGNVVDSSDVIATIQPPAYFHHPQAVHTATQIQSLHALTVAQVPSHLRYVLELGVPLPSLAIGTVPVVT